MSSIIKLLPDNIANQIAAGEVIQRPASVVKELLENSIDAKATEIILVIKDAGKTLIQVADNGTGMNETDARLCFERHATSKITDTDDLFAIKTRGFRGEALASIAAVAQVELKTKTEEAPIGTRIVIEGSEFKLQEPCNNTTGSIFSVKNLFFNTPARRKFLKSDAIEMKHIIEEFERVALAEPNVSFTFINNDHILYKLEKCNNHKQRIINYIGNNYGQKIIPVQETTNLIEIKGFISKPEYSKKIRGEQYLFVNNRFIKSQYLNNSIIKAYSQYIPENTYPSYFIYLTIDPSKIDVNIHPTKTEIKFEEESNIYTILNSAIKKSLGSFIGIPTIDFDREKTFYVPENKIYSTPKIPEIKLSKNYNPFKETKIKENWEKLYSNFETVTEIKQQEKKTIQNQIEINIETDNIPNKKYIQVLEKYIITNIKSGIVIIDILRAYERILYEDYLIKLSNNKPQSQQLLFPIIINLDNKKLEIFNSIKEDFSSLGFNFIIEKNSLIINGTPPEIIETNLKELIEEIIEEYLLTFNKISIPEQTRLSYAISRRIKHLYLQKELSDEAINNIIEKLFLCKLPYTSPSGEPIMKMLTKEDIEKILT